MNLKAKISVEIDSLKYDPSLPHHVVDRCAVWRVLHDGIHLDNNEAPFRTRGEPVTLRRIKNVFGSTLNMVTLGDSARIKMLAALIATESGGRVDAKRVEPRIDDCSFGICQLLTKTVWGLYLKSTPGCLPVPPPPMSREDKGPFEDWVEFLSNPETSIQYANAYLNNCANGCTDPIVLYAMYNAGGAYFSRSNDWGLRAAPGALDRFAQWYGDACEVFR